MSFFSKMSDSAGLVTGMASRLDVDLTEKMATSPETAARSYAGMVMRCAQCSCQEDCVKLQDENPMLDAAPDYCQNKDILHR